MNAQYPLTVYYDASCKLCSTEIHNIKIHDTEQLICLVDCSATDFDDTPFRAEGITRSAMMDRLHVRDSNGLWIKGVPSFELLYRTVGMTTIAKFWGGRITGRLAERVYPWIVRNRQFLSRIGIPILFKLWGKCAARRTHQLSRQCRDGQCSI